MSVFDPKNWGDETFIAGLIGTLLLLTPGATILFYFNRDLFLTLDVTKLILLSLSIIMPLLTTNFIFMAFLGPKIDSTLGKEAAFVYLLVSIFISSLILYIGIAFSWLLKIGINWLLWIVILLELILAFIFIQIIKK